MKFNTLIIIIVTIVFAIALFSFAQKDITILWFMFCFNTGIAGGYIALANLSE